MGEVVAYRLSSDAIARSYTGLVVRWRYPLVAVWVVLMACGAFGAAALHDRLSIGGWISPESESAQAAEVLADGYLGRGLTSSVLVIHDQRHDADDREFVSRSADALQSVIADPALRVRDAIGYSTTSGQAQAAFLGADRTTSLHVLGSDLTVAEALKAMSAVQDRVDAQFNGSDLDVSVVSTEAVWGEANLQSQSGLLRAEILTAPLILLVLLWLFRGVVASLLAGLVGGTAIIAATGTLGLLSHWVDFSIFVENIATMLGLAVGIDYSLLMLKRFEEELARGRELREAMEISVARAGHAVIASGVTVIVALASLLLIDLGAIASMAVGGMMVVAFAVLSVLVVLPTSMAILGKRVFAGRIALFGSSAAIAPEKSFWYRFSYVVMRRPVTFLIAGTLVCLICAAPALGMRLFLPDSRIIGTESAPRAGTERMIEQFGPGTPTPIQVVVRTTEPVAGSQHRDEIVRKLNSLSQLPHVVTVNSPLTVLGVVDGRDPLALLTAQRRESAPDDIAPILDFYAAADGHSFVAEVITDSRSASNETVGVLREVRAAMMDMPDGVEVWVGGETASSIDTNGIIESGLPKMLAVMLFAIAVVLFLSFRSYLLPLKALALNLLSVGATFGLLTVLFQLGWGGSVLPFEVNGYIVNFVPVMLLAIVLSLNTDYEVFLLSRVRESFLRSGDNEESVAEGIARTAPLISGAALLMVAVFAGFGLAGITPIEQLGIGAAIAIALDATLVRLVLVPAAMKLMGSWNWKGPGYRGERAIEEDSSGHVSVSAQP